MKRARTMSHRTAPARAGFGVLALALLLTAAVACSAPAGFGARDEASPAPIPTSAASAGAGIDPATADAQARLSAALTRVAAADRKPGTEQIRSALLDAGFPAGNVEVTASRTPTGLDADAVEVAVTAGRTCIVAQLRDGNVRSAVLPVLADGRCLVGTPG